MGLCVVIGVTAGLLAMLLSDWLAVEAGELPCQLAGLFASEDEEE